MSNVDKVTLNIGGVVFNTSKHTLLSQNSAFFEQLLSNEEDIYFVDRDPGSFSILLNYMRQHALNFSTDDISHVDFLLCEAQFFQLKSLQSELMQRRLAFCNMFPETPPSNKMQTRRHTSHK